MQLVEEVKNKYMIPFRELGEFIQYLKNIEEVEKEVVESVNKFVRKNKPDIKLLLTAIETLEPAGALEKADEMKLSNMKRLLAANNTYVTVGGIALLLIICAEVGIFAFLGYNLVSAVGAGSTFKLVFGVTKHSHAIGRWGDMFFSDARSSLQILTVKGVSLLGMR